MNVDLEHAVLEINKYNNGVHILNKGIDETIIGVFENQYNVILPKSFKKWLTIYNGCELFALPVGTSIFGILGNSQRMRGEFYLEDNFSETKRIGIPNTLFIIGELCDNEIIAFNTLETDEQDGQVVQFDVESAKTVEHWNSFASWLNYVLEEGREQFDYNGNEK